MDLSQLTDVELRETLKDHGIAAGPIVASTRKIYEKKLLKLVEDTNLSQNLNDSQLTDSDSVPAAEQSFEPIFKKKSPSPKKTPAQPRVVHQPSSAATEASVESDSDDCEESMRYLTEEEMRADRAYARQSLQSYEKKGTGFAGTIAYALVFIMIGIFVYYIMENAEKLKLIPQPNEDAV
ncbi:unnamed protein product [Caenorhabditis brenneri]